LTKLVHFVVEETAAHLFCDCRITNKLWVDSSSNLFYPLMTHIFILKDIFFI